MADDLTPQPHQPEPVPPPPLTYRERLAAKLADPDTLETVCAHVANGGSLTDLCRTWNFRYSDVFIWLFNAKDAKPSGRFEQFQNALKARDEWETESILGEVRALGLHDIRRIFDKDGNVLPPDKWPDDVAKAVAGFEVVENRNPETGALTGYTKKVKLINRKDSAELMMKRLKLLVNLNVHAVGKTLEELVAESMAKPPEPPPQA